MGDRKAELKGLGPKTELKYLDKNEKKIITSFGFWIHKMILSWDDVFAIAHAV